MSAFNNGMGVTKISFSRVIHNYCPLGADWYTNNIDVEMTPGETIPDYCDIDKMFNEINGQHLIIEQVVAQVFDTLQKDYAPIYLKVTSYVDDAVHLPVVVEKETK